VADHDPDGERDEQGLTVSVMGKGTFVRR